MAKRFWEKVSGTRIRFWQTDDATDYTQAEITSEITRIQTDLARPDDQKQTSIDASESTLTIEQYNDNLQDELDELQEIDKYFGFDTAPLSLDEIVPTYFTPISVDSFCAEDVGNEAALSIDGLNSTWWQDSTNHTHTITYRIENFRVKVVGFQIRRGANDRSELTNLEVRVANNTGGLDDDKNILISGVHLTTPADWNIVGFTKKQAGKLGRLTFDSAHASNEARIREIQFLLEPIKNL